MRNASKRVGLLASLSAAAAVVAVGVAIAAGTAVASTSVHSAVYRLSATLTASQEVPAVQAPAAVGHFHGVLFSAGTAPARVASLAGCKVVQGPRRSGVATKLNCAGSVVTMPAAGQWRLIWRLTYSHLSGLATRVDIHLAAAGQSASAAFALCGPCHSVSTGSGAALTHGAAIVTASQAASVSSDPSYVNVATAAHPDGEIRGQITRTMVGLQVGR